MKHTVTNSTDHDLNEFVEIVEKFLPYAQENFGFDQPTAINLISDSQNAEDLMGKTGYYDPQSMDITIYTDNRHPKDMLRSIAHELVHHAQNCRGDLQLGPVGENYAQEDQQLRGLEIEATKVGYMAVRDFTDLNLHLNENKGRPIKMINEEKKVRLAIRKALKTVLKEAISRDPGDNSPLTTAEIREFLRLAGGESLERHPPGVSPAGEKLRSRSAWSRGTSSAPVEIQSDEDLPGEELAALEVDVPEDPEAIAAAVAAAAEEEEETEEELDVDDDTLGEVLSEAHRKRKLRRKRARKAREEAAAESQPKPRPKKAAVKKVKKEVLKAAEPETEEAPLKEWYDTELFDRLLTEFVKK